MEDRTIDYANFLFENVNVAFQKTMSDTFVSS